MMQLLLASAVLALSLPLPAQLLVSPAALATSEGSLSTALPLSGVCRFQQVHRDLRGAPVGLKGIRLRGDGFLASTARTLDVELLVSDGAYAGFSRAFDNNHGPLRLNTFTRKLVNLPALANPRPPAPFTISLPFDVQYPYSGSSDLLWEARVHAGNGAGLYLLDAEIGWPPDAVTHMSAGFGTGCVATGRTVAMAAGLDLEACFSAARHAATFWTIGGPPNVPSTLWIGTATGVTPIPGLCTSLYVAPLATFTGVTSAAGMHAVGPFGFPYSPVWVGLLLSCQSAALDAARNDPIKLSLSDRASAPVPTLPPGGAFPIRSLYSAGDQNALIGSMPSHNFAIVVGFER
jgi:hypothetical protein